MVVVVVVIVIVEVVEVVLVVVVKSSPTPPATQLATGTAINDWLLGISTRLLRE